MKKNTISALYNYFVNSDDTIDLSAVVEDIRAEYERTVAKSQAKANAYDAAKPIVFGVMTEPMTVKEIFAKCENDLPDGFTAHKIQYALLNYWRDEVVKIDNGKSAFTYMVK